MSALIGIFFLWLGGLFAGIGITIATQVIAKFTYYHGYLDGLERAVKIIEGDNPKAFRRLERAKNDKNKIM